MERLVKLRELLKTERDEDFAQYQQYFLRDNISYRKQNGVTWYPVVITQTEIGPGEYLSVDIERTSGKGEPHLFSGGKVAALFSNNYPGEELQGTIKVLGPDKLRLLLNVDELPDWCEEGKLGINLLFDESSYREMSIALEKVIAASGNRLAQLRDVMYGKRPPVFEKTPVPDLPGLNASQQEAVGNILRATDIALVHGPPGTGKTTTLVHAIQCVLQKEKQVLVCSPSNTAVDLMTEKLYRAGVSVLRLGNPARISEEVLMNTLDAKIAAHDLYKEIKTYRKTADEYFRMAGKYKRNFGREEKEQRQLLYREGRKILQEARLLEDHILHEQFEKAQVIACTPVVSAGRMLQDRRFSTLFIDEAAQALEPMCWIPITRSDKVVFAGDHFQLPPTVKSKKAEAEGLKDTLFERCMQVDGVSVMLDTQYRMHEKIMGFSNEVFYGNKLKAHPSVSSATLSADPEFPLLHEPVNFIDTAGCGYTENINPESLSIANPEEAVLLLNYLKRLLQDMTRTDHAGKELTVGIISPYKEQVQYLAEQVGLDEELKKYPARVSVKTIDGFQGQERDVICISLVRSNDSGEIGFLNDTRRMNVALTRAKKKLVVVGDSATLASHPFYKKLIDHMEKIGAYHSAWEFIG